MATIKTWRSPTGQFYKQTTTVIDAETGEELTGDVGTLKRYYKVLSKETKKTYTALSAEWNTTILMRKQPIQLTLTI